jgi:alpha-glucosidase (family GH31 glycosyl hydrolase)
MDEELFVRWAQASALMGMVQMSISPWRVLSERNAALVAAALKLHADFSERIGALAQHAAQTGEPLVRAMAYAFPAEGFETVDDQFMLGDDVLVCPVLEKGAESRQIRLPLGQWRSWKGEVLEGGRVISLEVGLADTPYFLRA